MFLIIGLCVYFYALFEYRLIDMLRLRKSIAPALCHDYKLWPTPLPTNTVTPNRLYASLPAPVYIYAHCLFRMLFMDARSASVHVIFCRCFL